MFCCGKKGREEQREAGEKKSTGDCKKTTGDCPLAQIIVHVKTSDGADVGQADVVLVEKKKSGKTATDSGKHDFGKVDAGTYTVKASKDMHLTPASAEEAQKQVTVAEKEKKEVELVLDPVELHLHLDADRDGTVEDDRSGLDKWEWGAGKKGAIMLCNNDGDEDPSFSDHSDDKVNTGNDKDELAPIELRRKGPAPPATWKGVLKIDDKDHVRVFEQRTAGNKEVMGPKTKKDEFELPDLKFAKKALGMEALRYADGDFAGLVTVTFEVRKGAKVLQSEKGQLMVAPWIMPNHLDKAEKVYVVDFHCAFPAANPVDVYDWKANTRFRNELKGYVSAAGCTLVEHNENDQWMQDCMELGFANLPGRGYRATLAAYRKRPLHTFPETLRKADFGYHEEVPFADPRDDTTFDSTGNLEATPPCTSKAGKSYPFGRIYFGPGRVGEKMNPDVRTFLTMQIVQNPIEIDTDWLAVGHVDEMISIAPGGPKGFTLVLASPKRAYEILKANEKAHGSDKLLTGRKFPEWNAAGTDIDDWHDAEVSISDYLNTGIPDLSLVAGPLKTFNDDCQKEIDKARTLLKTELGLEESDIIDAPVLFRPAEFAPTQAEALTADMVNMLVVNKHCVVPKPFGPVVSGKDLFAEEFEAALKKLGLTVKFLDDWYEYHVNLGEVHCGTNTLREPTDVEWWKYTP